jgi:hypothetical protein
VENSLQNHASTDVGDFGARFPIPLKEPSAVPDAFHFDVLTFGLTTYRINPADCADSRRRADRAACGNQFTVDNAGSFREP